MNKIYRYKWIGIYTGWEYTYNIIPAHEDNINAGTLEIIEIPSGAISVENLEMGFDDLPIGMPKSAIMKSKIRLDLVPTTTEYNDLRNSLFKPRFVRTYSLIETTMNYGTVHRIYRTVGFDKYLVFEGIQTKGIKGKYNLGLDGITELEIEAEDIGKVILENMTMKYLTYRYIKLALLEYTDYDLLYKNGYIDFALKTTLYQIAITSAMPYINKNANDTDMKFVFIRLNHFLTYIKNLYDEYYKDAIRNYKSGIGINTSELEFIKTKFYTLNFTDYDILGINPSIANLHLLAGVFKTGKLLEFSNGELNSDVAGGLFHQNLEESLGNQYNNLYDFFNDLYSSNLNKLIIKNESEYLHSYPIYGQDSTIDIDLTDLITYDNLSINANESSYKSIVVSQLEVIESDYDKFESKLELTKNEKNLNLVNVFNNNPNTGTFRITNNSSYYLLPMKLDRLVGYYINNFPAKEHLFSIYYKDTQEPIDTGEYEFSRLHSYTEFKLDNDNYSDIIFPFVNQDILDLYGLSTLKDPTSAFIQLQKEQSNTKILSEVALNLFSKENIAEIEIDFNFDVENNRIFFKDEFTTQFNIDITQLEPYFDNLGTKWVVLKTKIDLINEKASLVLINNVVEL